ncbi:MAG: 3-oxoacyl-ACP synthase [Acidobacteria bacterium]|nr:3-oxoacyl-ACP synthase [Acidobacteriota bacterium]
MSSPVASHRARPLRVLGTGVAVSGEAVTSDALDARLGLPAGTIEERTGVRRRFVERRPAAVPGAEAARMALQTAGLTLDDIDCLVAASGTPDQAMPSNAALLHHELGLSARGIPAFDIGASCLGFLMALDVVSSLLASGRYRRVLIVASDVASCGLDWSRLESSGIFGDGAAAAVVDAGDGLTAAAGGGILAASFLTLSDGAHACEIPGGGSRHHPSRIDQPFPPLAQFHMDGPVIFRLAGERLADFVDGLLAQAGVTLADLELVVPHQASGHALAFMRRRLRLRTEQVVDIFAERGNQVGASLPTALHEAITSGRLRRGGTALLIGTGAGVQMGGIVLRH